ncbi:VWA domain-containing protein [Aerosakkonema sp. BLCC-F183]|uniref:VWA domain-containing protein n=1 Tax=Aerosakkonema sp. BLCC-F183 TaxID=3342834 RepID=UPI0035B9401D
MDAINQTVGGILQHLRSHNEPFVLHKGKQPQWNDEALHSSAYQNNAELYALMGVAKGVLPQGRDRILFQVLRTSRIGMTPEIRHTLDRITNLLLSVLHPDKVLTVFLALRRVRANHKHTAKAILNYILNHPDLEDMANCRRRTLEDCLSHAMGKNVARACAKMLSNPAVADQQYLRRHLLRFARDPEKVKTIFPVLYKQGTRQTGSGQYKLAHTQFLEKFDRQEERPKTITPTNRGDISATLIHLYRGGISAELQQALERYVEDAAKKLPRFHGKLALVLDASASTKGYGDREYCGISQSVAFQLVLEKCCPNLQIFAVGNSGQIPIPKGNTDIALALLDALETQPDLVAIVSDGYENIYPGDLARLVATLPQLGIHTPVVFCHSKFTGSDDLTLRRPATNLPQLEFWHQDDFEDLLISILSMTNQNQSEIGLREFLLKKLDLVISH